MADITDKFAGLPLGLLVCTPIIEVAKGQSELCRVYLDYVYKLAFIDGDPEKGTNALIQPDASGNRWQWQYHASTGDRNGTADFAGAGACVHDG